MKRPVIWPALAVVLGLAPSSLAQTAPPPLPFEPAASPPASPPSPSPRPRPLPRPLPHAATEAPSEPDDSPPPNDPPSAYHPTHRKSALSLAA